MTRLECLIKIQSGQFEAKGTFCGFLHAVEQFIDIILLQPLMVCSSRTISFLFDIPQPVGNNFF